MISLIEHIFISCFLFLLICNMISAKNLRSKYDNRGTAKEVVYDWRAANSSVTFSAIAYCGNETIMSGNYNDSSFVKDFVPATIIYNRYYDVNGFIGTSEAEKSIYVVFRGSMTITNWLDDFETLMTSYPMCSQCAVHAGFYYSAQSVKDIVIEWVQQLQKKYPTYDVIVTGHSLGGALATLTAVSLHTNDINNVRCFTYGSPRVGDAAAAAYISNLLPDIVRTTHYKDIVPHNPFTHFGYVHVSGEWYEDENGNLSACTGYEDIHCADQWTFAEDIADHMKYLGRSMWCTIGRS